MKQVTMELKNKKNDSNNGITNLKTKEKSYINGRKRQINTCVEETERGITGENYKKRERERMKN
jgi:hypothetical protein